MERSEIRDGCASGGLFPDCASLHPGYMATISGLPLPAADAARLAGPDLNPCIERLGIERTTVSPREFCTRRAARFLRARFCNPGRLEPLGMDDRGLNDLGPRFRFGARPRALACAIALGFDPNRLEFGRRPEPLRRQHGSPKMQPEAPIGGIVVRRRATAPRQQR